MERHRTRIMVGGNLIHYPREVHTLTADMGLVPYEVIPEEIKQQYQLDKLVHNGYVYIEIWKGMYSLPQAGRIAHDQLKIHLQKYGYAPVKHTPGL
eukprot:15364504-Ditylum_brightwellii.AAC.2